MCEFVESGQLQGSRIGETTLIEKTWLRRVLQVSTSEGEYIVKYDGRGFGWEAVFVGDQKVSGGRSWVWFIPRFDFKLGTAEAMIQVRVWPWLSMRRFSFSLNGVVEYGEERGLPEHL